MRALQLPSVQRASKPYNLVQTAAAVCLLDGKARLRVILVRKLRKMSQFSTVLEGQLVASKMNTTGNRLLDLLPEAESAKVLAYSQIISLPLNEVVFQQNGPVPHFYFPIASVIGVVLVVEGGTQVEGTTIGKEGMVGLPAFLGVDFHPSQAVVQVPAEAVRVPATSFLQAANSGSALDLVLRRYTLYRLRCANQTGACNTLHAVEERMCRWLLMTHDRAGTAEFPITHEFLSELLGVRRQTVSITAGMLQRAGLVNYRRGVLRVLDREGLEAASCECYEVLKQLHSRIMDVR